MTVITMARREYVRRYQREWISRRRAAWLLANGPCVRCAAWEDLQVDHIDPATKVHHAVWSWSQKRRATELAKCQVLCAGCHADKSTEQRWANRKREHGTDNMYAHFGCRCEPCRAAHSAVIKRRYLK